MNWDALDRLKEILAGATPAVIALSGGVDSRFLAQVAWRWGFEVHPLFFFGPQMTPGECAWVREWIFSQGRRLHILDFGPMDIPQAAANTRDRCYHCKRGLFSRARELATNLGVPHVLDGSNASDQQKFRPGLKALAELGVESPLALAGLTKEQIRQAAAVWGLAWPDQASRACLMTRFPYGVAPASDDLKRLGLAEDILANLGLADFRLRQPSAGEYLLQLASNEIRVWKSLEKEALQALKNLGIPFMRVLVSERTGGYYDLNRGQGLDKSY